MNLVVFLGSGISLASGHPDVGTLTERILNPQIKTSESIFLKSLNKYDNKARQIGGTYIANKYKKVGENYRKSSSYEDLYYLCEEIILFHCGLHNNSMVPAFMGALVEKLRSILKEKSKRKQLIEIGRYADAAKTYIKEQLIKGLTSPPEIKGLDLIVQLAASSQVTSLNILTLNHDLLVEEILLRNGIEFIDGFGKADGDVRWFEPDTFLSDTKVKLIKLHGSIDWYFVDGYPNIAKISNNNFTEKKDSNGKLFKFSNKSPTFLSGLNKINYYNSGMYTDIHYHFQRVLYQNSLMIMSGYGWGDDPINTRLMTWLDKKRDNKLILLHQNPDLLKDRSFIMDRDYSNWVEGEKLRPIHKWLSETTLDEVLKACV